MKKQKLILYFTIFIFIVLGLSLFTVNKDKQNKLMNGEIKNSGIIDKKKSWNTYEDAEYGFVISYPSYLDKSIRYEAYGEEGKYDPGKLIKDIGFSYNGLGLTGVKIYSDINFKNVDEYLEFKNNQKDMTRYEVEKKFLIDEIPVVVFHPVTVPPKKSSGETVYVEEPFLNEKNLVFLKDGKLFKIWTNFRDESNHEKVWNSFKFLD